MKTNISLLKEILLFTFHPKLGVLCVFIYSSFNSHKYIHRVLPARFQSRSVAAVAYFNLKLPPAIFYRFRSLPTNTSYIHTFRTINSYQISVADQSVLVSNRFNATIVKIQPRCYLHRGQQHNRLSVRA